MKMSEKEIAELNQWIEVNVFGRTLNSTWGLCDTRSGIDTLSFTTKGEAEDFLRRYKAASGEGCAYRKVVERVHATPYTTDRASSFAVLEKCAEKTEHQNCLYVGFTGGEWVVGHDDTNHEAVAETFPLAICQFARQLFTKAEGKGR